MQVANVCSYKQGQKMNFSFGANLAGFCIHSHIYECESPENLRHSRVLSSHLLNPGNFNCMQLSFVCACIYVYVAYIHKGSQHMHIHKYF